MNRLNKTVPGSDNARICAMNTGKIHNMVRKDFIWDKRLFVHRPADMALMPLMKRQVF